MTYSFGAMLVVILIACAILAGPILLMLAGRRALKRGLRRGRIMVAAGAILVLLALSPVAYYVYLGGGPWHSRILTQGTSPSGQEYCVLQAYNYWWAEPYTVSFWIRDTNGVWRWNYLEHEGLAWRSAGVTFSAEQAHVSRNEEPFRDIQMPTGLVEIATVLPGYQSHYGAKELTTGELFKQFAGRKR